VEGDPLAATVSSSSSPQDARVKNTHPIDTDETPAEENTRLLLDARQVAMAQTDDFYLGTQTVRNRVTWLTDGRHKRLVATSSLANPAPDEVIPSAILSIIVHITKRNCWLMPDQTWNTQSMFAKKFSDIKLTFTGCVPGPVNSQPNLDFVITAANLTHFMDNAQIKGAQQQHILVPHLIGQKIKFRHTPFVVSTTAKLL
jgi:hypothetical protein